MNQDLSIVNLILHASWVVQGVVALLVGVSIASWAAIIRKIMALKKVQQLNEAFDREFWSGTSLNDLAAGAAQNAKHSGSMERIFASGMRIPKTPRASHHRCWHADGRCAPCHAGQLPARGRCD